ncbi:MAG: hypothetical protein P4L99_23990 [Chthoniobacter sp.]|nr:hypothetical protein [Chthoniobacter sp.]
MKSSLRILSCFAVLATSTPCLVFAADAPAATPAAAAEPAKAKSKFTPLYAQVDSITDTLLTVKGTGPDLKFVINAETKITKDKAHKEAAKPSDVKVGQWIGGSYTKAADGSNVLHSLHLGVSQKGEGIAKPKP